MAPKRGTKRAAQPTADESADKKLFEFLKVRGVSRASYQSVVDALEDPLLVVPEDCRKMLVTMIPTSLCVPLDERQEFQVKSVEMIGDAIGQVQAKIKEAVDAAQAEVDAAEGTKSESEKKLQDAKDVLATEQANTKAAKDALAEASTAVMSGKTALAEKKDEQKVGDADYVKIQADIASLENVIANDLKALLEGSCDKLQAKVHFKVVTECFDKITLEESLKAVLPTALMKPPAERGSFDLMAVSQLDQAIQGKLNELKQAQEQHAPKAQEREAAVASAQKSLDMLLDTQKSAASEFSAAQDKEKGASDAVSAAEKDVASCEREVKKVSKVHSFKEKELTAYLEQVSQYEALKNKASAQPTPIAIEPSSPQPTAIVTEPAPAVSEDTGGVTRDHPVNADSGEGQPGVRS